MNDTVSIVTYPDDIQTDALRILTYDLTSEQSQLVSNTIQTLELPNRQQDIFWLSLIVIILAAQNYPWLTAERFWINNK